MSGGKIGGVWGGKETCSKRVSFPPHKIPALLSVRTCKTNFGPRFIMEDMAYENSTATETLARKIETLPSEYSTLVQKLVDALGELSAKNDAIAETDALENENTLKTNIECLFEPWHIDGEKIPTREELHER